MKIGIIGLPQAGKKTLFEILTGQELSSTAFGGQQEAVTGSAVIRDGRFERLAALYRPQKLSPATIETVLLPRFDKETAAGGELARSLEKCDALCHIVRAFRDGSVFHEAGSVDPLRDIDNVLTELILRDLILVEKRLERMALDRKKGIAGPQQAREREILTQMKALLDENRPLTHCRLGEEDRRLISTYHFLTQKPMILVLNVDDSALADESLICKVKEKHPDQDLRVIQISAKIEAELAALDEADRREFLDGLGIKEPALNRLSALCFEALGLISFFTVGPTEVHQWTVRRGASAPQAAGVIHTDLEKGFIRAEIFKYEDLMELGSEQKVRESGRWHLKGRDYIMEDGDIMVVRFQK